MLDRRYCAVLSLGMLVGASLLFLCVANPAPAPTPVNYLLIGYILGTLYGQTTLAAAWAALGPFPLVWRLPGSLAWIAALIVSVAISLANELLETIAVLTGCALAQWLFLQIPLWLLRRWYGLKLQHRDEPLPIASARQRQFGIRQLLLLTTIIAVVLAIGRLVAREVMARLDLNQGELPIFLFLAAMSIVTTLPLVMATLLTRWAKIGTAVVVVLLVLATEWELPLGALIVAPPPGGPDLWHYRCINAIAAVWIVSMVGILRLSGFNLVASRPPPSLHR